MEVRLYRVREGIRYIYIYYQIVFAYWILLAYTCVAFLLHTEYDPNSADMQNCFSMFQPMASGFFAAGTTATIDGHTFFVVSEAGLLHAR